MLAHAMTRRGASQNARGLRCRRATSSSRAAKIAIANSCGRSASAGAARAKATSPRIDAVLARAPRAIAVATSSPIESETSAARRTTSSSQPPARNPSARSTCASHCWSVHGVPATVNV